MKMVSLPANAVHSGNLILVNRDYPLREGLCEKRLVPVDERSNKTLLAKRAATILQELISDMECGEKIIAVSGFRSKYEQARIYETSLLDNGSDFTAKYVALPGSSEHQTGLAVDLALNQPDINVLRPYFPYTGICGDFRGKAVQYGFIERYPEGKERITGIAHEPWHFRYVGVPHAAIMRQRALSLEEYIELLRGYPFGGKRLRFSDCGRAYEISFVEAENEIVELAVPDAPYLISGNNVDGFIITEWR